MERGARMEKAILRYFDPRELVCPHTHGRFGDRALGFMDDTILRDLLFVREGLGLPVRVNNWHRGGDYSQRGFRCVLCPLVRSKAVYGSLYVSAHILGKAVDFTVDGMSAERVRQWIKAHSDALPHPCRLEEGVSWVHMDTRTDGSAGRVTTFKG